jgi:hypothetical protein
LYVQGLDSLYPRPPKYDAAGFSATVVVTVTKLSVLTNYTCAVKTGVYDRRETVWFFLYCLA